MEMQYTIADDATREEAELGRLLFAQETDFLKGVVAMDGMPPADRMEICFAGRSNVGKSSLINALTGRKSLARTSNTPGRTQEINFFTLSDSHYLVDVPGYGFANAPPTRRQKMASIAKGIPIRPCIPTPRLPVDRFTTWRKGRGRRDHGIAGPFGCDISGGSDQGRQAKESGA